MNLPIVEASEAHMKRHEVREGLQLVLEGPVPCTVSFSRGAEKHVVLAVHALQEVGDFTGLFPLIWGPVKVA